MVGRPLLHRRHPDGRRPAPGGPLRRPRGLPRLQSLCAARHGAARVREGARGSDGALREGGLREKGGQLSRATEVRALSSIAVVALLASAACTHAPVFKYEDDADVADLKEQFSCGGAPLTVLQR